MKGCVMRLALTVLSLLAVTGCAAPAADTASPPATSSSKAPAAKPKVDNSANKTACSSTRREVGKRAEVFSGAADGTSLPADVAEASRELQKEFADTALYAEGPIGAQVKALSTAYGRIRVSITTGDNVTLAQAVKAQGTGLAELGRLCEAIGA